MFLRECDKFLLQRYSLAVALLVFDVLNGLHPSPPWGPEGLTGLVYVDVHLTQR